MAEIATVGSGMSGNVSHHAGHIIGYTGGEYPSPIYCSGHSVSGKQESGESKFLINGIPVALVGKKGTSNCPCDGQGFTNEEGSPSFLFNGIPVARKGDRVDLHGTGKGEITTGVPKFLIP